MSWFKKRNKYSYFSRDLGNKQYEISNHLGNVLSTITDIILTTENGSTGTVDTRLTDIC